MVVDLKRARPVRTLKDPSAEQMLRWRYRAPVVLKGALQRWPLLAALQQAGSDDDKLAVLSALLGDEPVVWDVVAAHQRGQFGFSDDLRSLTVQMSHTRRGRFVDLSRDIQQLRVTSPGAAAYLQSASIRPGSPLASLVGDLPSPVSGRALWVGSGGQVVNLHWDRVCNFICMLAGHKRVALFPFRAVRFLYPAPLNDGPGGAPSSFVRLLEPDLDRFPLFVRAVPLMQVALLEPGDALYVPPFWWHHVESFGLNVMASVHYKDLPEDRAGVDDDWWRAMILFHRMPSTARRRFARCYRDALAGRAPSPTMVEQTAAAATAVIDEVWIDEVRRHLGVVAQRTQRLPPYWQRVQRQFFDHFVFQRHGDPIAALPGAFERMLMPARSPPGDPS